MRILLLEPFMGGSHAQWANGYKLASKHEVSILSMPARNWKWRMHGAAVELAEQYIQLGQTFDLIIASDMLDLAAFLGLAKVDSNTKVALYFHENQLTYPWSENDMDRQEGRDNHYAFINYTSALAADAVFYNSNYHRESFLNALPAFLKMFPDQQGLSNVDVIRDKSAVLHLGMDLQSLQSIDPPSPPNRAVVLWNHRWEYDKNPEAFFEALLEIRERGWEFKLIVLGQNYSSAPKIFEKAREKLADHILHWGYCDSREEYVKWLGMADILPVTAIQDFFGGSVVEAMYLNVIPLLPKRLAYPEHVPENLHSSFFYDENELVNKLQRWIKDVPILRKQTCRQFVEKYDWTLMAPIYDSKFESMID